MRLSSCRRRLHHKISAGTKGLVACSAGWLGMAVAATPSAAAWTSEIVSACQGHIDIEVEDFLDCRLGVLHL